MKTLLGCSILVGLAVTLQAETPRETAPRFQVHVYNFAGLSNDTLVRAMREAGRIFEQGGIEMSWIHCPPFSSQGPAKPTPCQHSGNVPEFEVRLLSASAAARLVRDPQAHGLAQFTDDGRPSSTVYVFAHRAEDFTAGNKSFYVQVLGCLVSHELGHLLIPRRNHSVAGLMHVPWRGEELEMVFQGTLGFHPKEVKRVHGRLREILQAEARRPAP